MPTNEQIQKIVEDAFKIEVEVLEGGRLPEKAHKTDAGFDLFATSDIEIKPGEVFKHPLNIRFGLPENSYLEITSKSGLASKGLIVFGGIIDSGYTGIPHVIFSNINYSSQCSIIIKKGFKIAQGIMHPFNNCFYIEHVEKINENGKDRGSNGFGSSGS